MQFNKFWLVMIIMGVVVLAACGPTGDGIDEITSIPDSELNAQPTATYTPPVASISNTNTDASNESSGNESASQASPTPLDNNLEAGEARLIAAATDEAYQPTPRSEVIFEDSPVGLFFSEFYDGFNMRTGLVLSDKLVSLDGNQVVMEGYVAPPLKPKLDFFVLTSIPLSSCPFCSTAADWPDDIALVYLTQEEVVYTPYPVRITGRLEIGSSVDAETGMVSLVRIYAEKMEVLE